MKSSSLGCGGSPRFSFAHTLLWLSGALAFSAGCASDATPDNGGYTDTSGGASASNNGSTPSNNNGSTPSNNNGSTPSNNTGGGDDAGPGGGDAADDPATPGNDSPEATACTGASTCPYSSHSCCVAGLGDAECIDGSTCPSGGLLPKARTVCDGPEDCGNGEVCCVAVNPTGASNTCEASCEDVSGLIGVWQLCHTDDDCPADKGSCAADDSFPFWGFCG